MPATPQAVMAAPRDVEKRCSCFYTCASPKKYTSTTSDTHLEMAWGACSTTQDDYPAAMATASAATVIQ
jgi:hypothetical protein